MYDILNKEDAMKIEWLGHACFLITSTAGLKIITDPYEPNYRDIIKHGAIDSSADIVTVSHEHGDHNYVSAVAGNPAVIVNTGITKAKDIEFIGLPSYHDQTKGSERGVNTIFKFEVDGIRITHLGDLGHQLSDEKLADIEGTDILFAPTGGPGATLELKEMIEFWENIRPQVVIPMHFKMDKCIFPKYGVDDLIQLRPETIKAGNTILSISKDELPDPIQIYVLEYSR